MTSFYSRGARTVGVVAGAVASLGLLGPAFAGEAGLRERIEARFDKARLAEHGQVAVEVADGRAVLSGFTTTVDARSRAEKAARKETKLVDNRIRVVPAEAVPDPALEDAVADAVLGYVHYGVFDSVGLGVEEGVVTLVGSVSRPWRKDDIERRVARVAGVREIRNDLRVQPVSTFDDRLRLQLYRQIYGNGLFQRYATFVNPPIRIVVENGNVTLTGLVNSPVEKAVLGSIARGTLAFRVENLVQVESEVEKERPREVTAG